MDHKEVDILHPLTSLKWRAMCRRVPVSSRVSHAVYLGDNVYVSGTGAHLYIYHLASDAWNAIDTPVYGYALTDYNSQILLVGGKECVGERKPTNKVWRMTEDYKWQTSLPPMEVACSSALAAGHRDYIFVCDCDRNEIYVFDSHDWARAEHPPMKLRSTKSSIVGNHWYLTGESFEQQRVIYASLESLIATLCQSSDGTQSTSVWKALPHVPGGCCSLAEYGNRLIAVGSSAIYAYSSCADLWIHVGDIPVPFHIPHSIVLPSSKLMIITKKTNFMVKLKITPFNTDKPFNLRDLSLLEAVGLPVMSSLKDCSHLKRKQGSISLAEPWNEIKKLLHWSSSKTAGSVRPTWRNLLKLLRQLQMDDLAGQVETYLKEPSDSMTHCQSEGQSSLSKEVAWELPGVEVCGERTLVLSNSEYQRQVTWEGFGLKLFIEEDCLPAGLTQCVLKIKASLAGQYEFPENSRLVSAIFWLCCEPTCKFTKPIMVEIQHCAKLKNVTDLNLKFVRAFCSPKQLPYSFKPLGGDFTGHSSYGVIKLNSFSGLAITQEVSDERQYCSKLFYLSNYFSSHRIDLVITWDTEAHLNVVKKHYREDGARPGPDQPIEFESDEIRVDLPMEEIKIKDSWTIIPLIDPVVTKNEVDSYVPGKRIPHCEIEAHPICRPVDRLIHQMVLLGAKPPRNKFTLSYMPPSQADIAATVVSSTSSHHTTFAESAKPKLKDLHKELYSKVADVWEDIGIQLEIDEGQLRQIKSDNPGNSNACLRELLRTWLSRVDPPPSWAAIADAIETLNFGDIASHLRTQYCTISPLS